MKIKTLTLIAISAFIGFSAPAFSQGPVEKVIEGCTAEIENYCSQVTPGEARLLACFYAHEDKLSGQCQYSLYSASVQLEQAVNALTYLATQCRNDIMKLCATVEAGEGRILECLDAQADAVSERCTTAIGQVVVE